jgi:hypothetical protein
MLPGKVLRKITHFRIFVGPFLLGRVHERRGEKTSPKL